MKSQFPGNNVFSTFYFFNLNNLLDFQTGDKKSKDKPVDYVSAAILGKVMEERAKEREEMWQKKQEQNQKYHCQSCLCFKPNLDKSLALLNSETCDQAVETEADMRERSPSNSGDGDNYSLQSNEIDSVFIDMASSGSTGINSKSESSAAHD